MEPEQKSQEKENQTEADEKLLSEKALEDDLELDIGEDLDKLPL